MLGAGGFGDSNMDWGTHTPEVFYQAGRRKRDEVERELDKRDQKILSHLGVPLLAAVPLSVVAVAVAPLSTVGLILTGAPALVAWLLVAIVFGCRLHIRILRKADRALYSRDSFAYGMRAAGGPGVLEPTELLSLARRGNPEICSWLENHVDTKGDRETFEALAPQWTGTSSELAAAARNL